MAYVITDACVSCGACAAQCPVEAISEGDDKYVIDADTCVECGACAAQCTVEAIEEAYEIKQFLETEFLALFLFLTFFKTIFTFLIYSVICKIYENVLIFLKISHAIISNHDLLNHDLNKKEPFNFTEYLNTKIKLTNQKETTFIKLAKDGDMIQMSHVPFTMVSVFIKFCLALNSYK